MAEVYSVEVMALKPPEYVIQQYGEYTSTRNDNMQSCFHDQWRCRIAFKSSLTAEFLKRATNRIKEWKSTSTNREKEITEVLSRAVSLCREKKSCPSRDAAALPFQTFFSQTSVFEIDYLGLGNKCHADILGILPRCLLLSQNGAQKKKEKKGGGIEKAALYGVLLLYEDLHQAGYCRAFKKRFFFHIVMRKHLPKRRDRALDTNVSQLEVQF